MILPIQYPPITHIPENTNILSILTSDKTTYQWMYYNYMHIEMNTVYKNFPYESFCHFEALEKNVFIKTSEINKEILDIFEIGILKFVEKCIKNEIYLTLPIDMYYIQNYKHYNTNHSNHRILVYGYDEEALYCADFFGTKYSFQKVLKSSLAEAFYQLSEEASKLLDEYNTVDAQRYVEIITLYSRSKKKYKFNIQDYISKLEEYIYGYNEEPQSLRNIKYYDTLIKYLFDADKECYIRPFTLLKSQKIIIDMAIEHFLSKSGQYTYLKDLMKEYFNKIKLVISIVVKFNLTKDDALINRLVIDTYQLKYLDFEITNRFIDALKNNI